MTKVNEEMLEAGADEVWKASGNASSACCTGTRNEDKKVALAVFTAMTAAQDEQEAIPENPRRNPYPQLVETADGFVHAADGDWELMTDSGRQILRKVEPQSVQVDREYPYEYGYTGPKGFSAPEWMPAKIVGFTARKIKLKVLDGERGEFSVTAWPEFVRESILSTEGK